MQSLRKAWTYLAELEEDAAEYAQLLYEATPKLGVSTSGEDSPRKRVPSPRKSMMTSKLKQSVSASSLSLLDRLKAAEPMSTGQV